MKAVILAGGLGMRLRPFTETIPKPLLPIGEKAVLEIQIEKLASLGFKEIYLATNYKSSYIKNFFGDGSRYGVKIMISKESTPLGTAGPIKLLESELDEPFIVMNGDILSQLNYKILYDFALEKKSMLTLSIKRLITPFEFGNIFYEGDFVTGIEEKPDLVNYILAGIYVFTPEILKHIPKDEYFGMDQLINKLLGEQIPISKYEITDYWLDIGRIEDYKKAQEIYQEHFKDENE